MIDKIQIREEQAREMLNVFGGITYTNAFIIKAWKEKGYIKKTKLEEARAYADSIRELKDDKIYDLKSCIVEIQGLYEQAIKEVGSK